MRDRHIASVIVDVAQEPEMRLRTDYDLHEEENDIKNQEEHNLGRTREGHGLRSGKEDGVATFGGRWLMSNRGCWGLPHGFIDYRGSVRIPGRPFVRSRHADREAECGGEQASRRLWW